MTSSQAIAEVFAIAFRALPKKERQAVLALIANDKEVRKDMLDLAVFAKRRDEPSRSFREFLPEQAR
jgi:hypothetical protein